VRERGAVRSLCARHVDVTELRQLFGREGFGGAEHHTPGVVTTTSRRPCVARSAGRALYAGRPEGIMKTFPLRGIKDTPPYLHDGCCPKDYGRAYSERIPISRAILTERGILN